MLTFFKILAIGLASSALADLTEDDFLNHSNMLGQHIELEDACATDV